MDIKEHEGESSELAKFLRSYWETRDMSYPQEWAEKYIKEGHKIEIIDDKFFTARDKDEIIGSVSLIFWEGGVAEMRDFFVKEGHRSEGIGKKLFERAYKECRNRNVRKIHAKIFPYLWNFFKGQGFKSEGLLHDHFEEGEDLMIVGKFLSEEE